MGKLLVFVLIIAMLLTGAILFLTQRYEALTTTSGSVVVFDKLKCSFIEKNAKGEWEESGLKKGEIFMGFKEDPNDGATSPSGSPDTAPIKTAPAKKELKI